MTSSQQFFECEGNVYFIGKKIWRIPIDVFSLTVLISESDQNSTAVNLSVLIGWKGLSPNADVQLEKLGFQA